MLPSVRLRVAGRSEQSDPEDERGCVSRARSVQFPNIPSMIPCPER